MLLYSAGGSVTLIIMGVIMSAKVIAHRGASSGAPENTLASLELAAICGAKWVEFDVQLTSDDELVVTHDFSLERVSSSRGLVVTHNLAQLSAVDVGSWFSPSFGGQKIPTFSQYIDKIIEYDLSPIIEIKTKPEYATRHTSLVCEYLLHNWPKDREMPMISSFEYSALEVVYESKFNANIGFSSSKFNASHIPLMHAIESSSYHIKYCSINADQIALLKAQDFEVLGFTINCEQQMHDFLSKGADGVFVDKLELMSL